MSDAPSKAARPAAGLTLLRQASPKIGQLPDVGSGPYREPRQCRAAGGPHIEEDEMHPIIAQALVAERIRESREHADQHRLAKQALRNRRGATPAAAEPPRLPDSRRAMAPVAPVSEQSGIGTGRQPARKPSGVR
jgi:hypothetical protein